MPLEDTNPAVGLLENQKIQSKYAYDMEWLGSKIPRGATIDGVPISWTQNGMITGENGVHLGLYDRMQEGGYNTAPTHIMRVLTNKPVEVCQPDGVICPPIGD